MGTLLSLLATVRSWIVTPLALLWHAARRVERGEPGARVEVRANDEIGTRGAKPAPFGSKNNPARADEPDSETASAIRTATKALRLVIGWTSSHSKLGSPAPAVNE